VFKAGEAFGFWARLGLNPFGVGKGAPYFTGVSHKRGGKIPRGRENNAGRKTTLGGGGTPPGGGNPLAVGLI